MKIRMTRMLLEVKEAQKEDFDRIKIDILKKLKQWEKDIKEYSNNNEIYKYLHVISSNLEDLGLVHYMIKIFSTLSPNRSIRAIPSIILSNSSTETYVTICFHEHEAPYRFESLEEMSEYLTDLEFIGQHVMSEFDVE